MTPAEKLAKEKQTIGKVPWGKRSKRSDRKQAFAPKLKTLRQSLGLTHQQVADGAKLGSATNARDAELGFDIFLTTALKLARFYGVAVESIWSELKKSKE